MKPLPLIDCAYTEKRRTEFAATALERYRRSLEALLPLDGPQPVVLEYRSALVDEAHGYGFYPQAFYREGSLVSVLPNALLLEGLELGWDGTIIKAEPTEQIEGATRIFVRHSACRCPDRSLVLYFHNFGVCNHSGATTANAFKAARIVSPTHSRRVTARIDAST